MKVGIILGSTRPNGNSHGLSQWVKENLARCNQESTDIPLELTNIFPREKSLELGPIEEDIVPALVTDGSYANENVRLWSSTVTQCSGFVIITPQHNWGYPGDLKTALDHLYLEWRGKPVMVITYGGHGGGKCNIQLREVLTGLKMRVVEENVCITLPGEFIRGQERIGLQSESERMSFFCSYTDRLTSAIQQFRDLLGQHPV